MLPFLPFLAGAAVGVVAANALRRDDVQGGLHKAGRAVRSSVERVRRSGAAWRQRWASRHDSGEGGDMPALEMDSEIEMIDAADDDTATPRRRSSTRRSAGGTRRRSAATPSTTPDAEVSGKGEGSEGGPA